MTSTREREQGSWSTTTVLFWTFVVSFVLTALAVFCLGWLRFQDPSWLWNKKQRADQLYDVFRSAVTLVGVTGIAVGGALALRRQQVNEKEHDRQVARDDAERSRDERDHERAVISALRDRFVVAAEQMGASTLSQRLAGVYAMAGVADEWLQDTQREREAQICIDVLCAYLRTAQPDPNSTSQGEAASASDGSAWDVEVRQTIVRVIASRITPGTSGTEWTSRHFDFTGANFGGQFNFDGAVFSGGFVSFARTTFSAGTVSFRQAEFSGGLVSFYKAEFSGADVSFYKAEFSAGTVSFREAEFPAGLVTFSEAEFSHGTVSFCGSAFAAGTVSFSWAQFSGGHVDFNGSTIMDVVALPGPWGEAQPSHWPIVDLNTK